MKEDFLLIDTTAQSYLAKEMDVDILIFGHLHRPLIEKNELCLSALDLLLNPGCQVPVLWNSQLKIEVYAAE